jgi:outer membrane lipase/esterase
MHRIYWTCILTLVGVATSAAPLAAAPFRSMAIFGDSFSDTGNVYAATLGFIPAPPFFQGRFSNGPVWVDYLAGDLGLSITANGSNPAEIRGNNFAVGGAKAATAVETPLGTIPSLVDQVNYFLAASLLPLPEDALYVVFAGNNDLRDAVNPSQGHDAAAQQQIMQSAADAVAGSVEGLAAAGARHILVLHVGDLGRPPETGPTQRNNSAASTAISVAFNARLSTALADLTLPAHTRVIEFDTFAFGNRVYDDGVNQGGAVYGITNFTTPIFRGYAGSPGADPAVSAFADDLHLSSLAHAILAEEVYRRLVPEPSALVLLLATLPLLATRSRPSH